MHLAARGFGHDDYSRCASTDAAPPKPHIKEPSFSALHAGKDFKSLFVVWATGHITETLPDIPYTVKVYSSDFANASKPGASPPCTPPDGRFTPLMWFCTVWRSEGRLIDLHRCLHACIDQKDIALMR